MQTAEEIMQQGQNISEISSLVWTLAILAIIALATTYIVDFVSKKNAAVTALILTTGLLWITTVVVGLVEHRENINQLATWREEVVYPYITTLDYDEKPFVSMEEVQPVDGVSQPPVVKYQDNENVVKIAKFPNEDASIYQTKLDIPIGETPVVRFYKLEEDLGNGFVPGVYPLTVHLNELEE